jgi:hypothetical protein
MKMQTAATPSVTAFFDQYARALEQYDTKGMAYLYHSPCTMVSDETTSVFNDPGKLEGFFNVGAGFYRQFGIAHARPEVWTRRDWTGRIINVKVQWQYLDALMQPVYDCEYQYVLKTDKHNQWKILLSVSVNEKEQMEQWRSRS